MQENQKQITMKEETQKELIKRKIAKEHYLEHSITWDEFLLEETK